MRCLAALVVGVSVGSVAVAVPEDARAAPPPPPGVVAPSPSPASALGRIHRIVGTEVRLETLLANARKDRAELLVDVFASYSDVQLIDRTRVVTVAMLLDVVGDGAVTEAVRRRAAAAIVAPRVLGNDPALSLAGRRAARPRARFSDRVARLAVARDPVSRELAAAILEGLWGPAGRR